MLLFMIVGVLLLPGKPFSKLAKNYYNFFSGSSLTMAQEACTDSTIGSNIQMELSNSENVGYRYYLNTAEPARCNGSITSVGYCYYGPRLYNHTFRFWATAAAVYRPEVNGSFRRVSDGLLLTKLTPSNQSSVSPENTLLLGLGFNCDTYILDPEDAIHVRKGDIFGALIFADQPFLHLGGLDLVGNSSGDYQLMTKSFDGFAHIQLVSSSQSNVDIDLPLPEILNGLSLDTKRVLHIFADISKSINLVHEYTTHCLSINFTVNPSIISPSRPSIAMERSTLLRETIMANSKKRPISMDSPQATAIDGWSVTENDTPGTYFTQSSTQPAQNSPPQVIVICGVLGAILIIAILISIAIVIAVLHRRVSQVSSKPAINLQHPPIGEHL